VHPGFRIDPLEKLQKVLSELVKLHQVYTAVPAFGVEYTLDKEDEDAESGDRPAHGDCGLLRDGDGVMGEGDPDIVPSDEDPHAAAVAAYYVEGADEDCSMLRQEVEYDRSLGLAVEAMQEGITLDLLWRLG